MVEQVKNSRSILIDLGLSESEVQVYLKLVEQGALTARELLMYTKGKRPTIYYALRQLMDRGLVTKQSAQQNERFQAEPPNALLQVVKLRQQKLEALESDVNELIPFLKNNGVVHEGAPGVLYFQGEEAMERAIMDTLYCKSGHIDSLAPQDNFFWQIGQSFSSRYIAERAARGITTRNLWEAPLQKHILNKSYRGLSEIRIMPKQMMGRFQTTVFLYDNQVMYISSTGSQYVLVVKSREHYDLLHAMYDGIWGVSEKISY